MRDSGKLGNPEDFGPEESFKCAATIIAFYLCVWISRLPLSSGHPSTKILFAMKVRVDKWLWSVRIFRSRTLATDACKAGKVKCGNTVAKPALLVGEGDLVTVRKDGFNFQFRVLQAIEKRVGAPIAVTCYLDLTPPEERNKYQVWFLNAAATAEKREKGTGRPTKKDRRELEEFKDVYDWGE